MLFGKFIEETNAYINVGKLKLTKHVISKNQKMQFTDLL